MSRQVDETLDVLGLVRDRYLRDPSLGVRRHRIEATRDVANSMGGIDYRTVLDKYRRKMGLKAVVELDQMILTYLMDPLNTELERALQTLAVDENDLLRIDQFFAHDEEAALVDIGLGGVFGTDLVQRRHRSVSAEELASRQRNAADIGRRAEALLDRMLNDAVKSDEIRGYEWMSKDDVTQPCDFSFIDLSGNERYLEVKGTKLTFSRPFHVAWNELVFGSEKGAAWLLCRVSELDNHVDIRFAAGGQWAAAAITTIRHMLPPGCQIDSLQVSAAAALLSFEKWPPWEVSA